MKSPLIRAVSLILLLFLPIRAQHLPPGFQPATSGTRHEIAGYSIVVPGKGWIEGRAEDSIVFAKRIDATESYHAGLSVTAVPSIANKAEFSALAERLANSGHRNPRYKILRNDHTESEAAGLWMIRGRVDFEDSGAVNVGKHGALATQNAHIIAMDPREPGQVIRVWFSWRTVEFDEAKFIAEAEKFFATFQRLDSPAAVKIR